MLYSKDGLHLTEEFEGCKLVAYPDPGTGGAPWTIGYGHTAGVREGDTCTQEQAEAWLTQDTQAASYEVSRLVKVVLTQEEFDALVDFQFNTGHLAGSTLLKLLNAGDLEGAAKQLERWDMAGGVHMAGLLRRRLAEEALFMKGENDV